jgi:hypothetical protein
MVVEKGEHQRGHHRRMRAAERKGDVCGCVSFSYVQTRRKLPPHACVIDPSKKHRTVLEMSKISFKHFLALGK